MHYFLDLELRKTDQFTSGRISSHVTRPPVASSIAGQRAAGICLLPLDQKQTIGIDILIATANSVNFPRFFR